MAVLCSSGLLQPLSLMRVAEERAYPCGFYVKLSSFRVWSRSRCKMHVREEARLEHTP